MNLLKYLGPGHYGEADTGVAMEGMIDPEYGISTQDHFLSVLALERKRTERSKRPFILMLIDLNELTGDSNGIDLIRKTISLVSAFTREIDVRGWYERMRTLGVIFTELGEHEVDEATERIQERVLSGLLEILGGQKLRKVSISMHVFPEGTGRMIRQFPANPALYPDLEGRGEARRVSLVLKRIVDIVGSLAALLLFSPLFLIIAVLIKYTSKGPVFYKQERIGRFGKRFKLIKFRSMYVNNDESIHREYVTRLIKNGSAAASHQCTADNGGVYKITDDPRVTSIGRIIRKASLDELPQFLNVLMGDMSLVGPRPPIGYELDSYDLWHRRRILEMKPGITGIWQVYGRSRTTFDEMVRMDLRYTKEWCLWLDFKLMLQTPAVVLHGDGAY